MIYTGAKATYPSTKTADSFQRRLVYIFEFVGQRSEPKSNQKQRCSPSQFCSYVVRGHFFAYCVQNFEGRRNLHNSKNRRSLVKKLPFAEEILLEPSLSIVSNA